MKVLGTRIVFTPIVEDSVSSSGIIYERAESKIPNVGLVEFVGEECKDIKVGDKVVYSVTGSTRAIEHQGVEYFYVDKYVDLLLYKPKESDNFLPVSGRIMIEELASTKTTDGGIDLISIEKRPTQCSKVISVGENEKGIQNGDYVTFIVNMSNTVMAENEHYHLVNVSHAIAVSDVPTE